MRWKFLQDEQFLAVIAPFTVTGCTTTSGSTTVTTTVPLGFTAVVADDYASGGGLRAESMVSSTGATSIQMAVAASATVTGATLTFQRHRYALASNYKSIFSVRLLGVGRRLFYRPRRTQDVEVSHHDEGGEPYGYDLYPTGENGKIGVFPPNAGADTLFIKYYRRMTLPSATASEGLDVPADYDDVFMAMAKAHYLVDKGQPHMAQWKYWNDYGVTGLKEIRQDERLVEDEDLTLLPPQTEYLYGPNNARFLDYWG